MMTTAATITAPLDRETMALVDRLARRKGISGEDYAAEAIRRVAETETDFEAFIQQGIDALDRGDVVPHEEVMADLDRMIERQRGRCR